MYRVFLLRILALRWVNSPNRVRMRFHHHGVLYDEDGTLSVNIVLLDFVNLCGSLALPLPLAPNSHPHSLPLT